MRNQGKRQRFIVMTDYAEVHTAVESMKLGSEDYIPKRLIEEQLLPLVQTIRKEQERTRRAPIFRRTSEAYLSAKHRAKIVALDQSECDDSGRERNRKGAFRPVYPRKKQTGGQAVCRSGLRLVVFLIGTICLLRACERSIYRCRCQSYRIFPGSGWRDIVSRRSGQSNNGYPTNAVACHTGTAVPSRRRKGRQDCRCAVGKAQPAAGGVIRATQKRSMPPSMLPRPTIRQVFSIVFFE